MKRKVFAISQGETRDRTFGYLRLSYLDIGTSEEKSEISVKKCRRRNIFEYSWKPFFLNEQENLNRAYDDDSPLKEPLATVLPVFPSAR